MTQKNIDWRETTFARDRTIGELQQRIFALEVSLKKWADDCAVHIEANLTLKASVAELEEVLELRREMWKDSLKERDALKAKLARDVETDRLLFAIEAERDALKARVAELEDHLRELAKSPGVRNAMLVVKTGGKVW